MKQRRIAFFSLVCVAMAWQADAQTFDNSGNKMLSGNYYFREVYFPASAQDAVALYGEINFSGSGTYTFVSATGFDAANNNLFNPSTTSGTYTISASGLGYISNPLASGDQIQGLVGQGGIFIAGSTQSTAGGSIDMFVAAPLGSATSPPFQGSYTVAFSDVLDGFSASFQLNPNGANVGNVNVNYYGTDQSTGAFYSGTSGEGTVGYKASSGAEVLSFPTNNQNLPIIGQEFLYVSPDGNFIFGGSSGWVDMFVGVRTSSTPNVSGLYYQAGLDLAGDDYYGSLDAIPSIHAILGHQRILPFGSTFFDDTYSDSFTLNADGSYDDAVGIHHVFDAKGDVGVGFGTDGNSGINVTIQAPSLTPASGIYLDPTGVQNTGSFTLFTAGVAPGEYIQLNGTGFTSTPLRDPSLPTTLGGIEVLVNGRASPILSVSPTLLTVVVPWELSGLIVQIQVVTTSGTRSNAITVFSSQTAPGVMTQSANGLGDAAAQHASNFKLITPANPAQPGETIVLYAVGLGITSPLLNDGQVADSKILSLTQLPISVFIDGVQANIVGTNAILVPTLVNLYQLNVVVPSGISSGEDDVEITGPDSDAAEATISIGSSGVAAAARAETRPHRRAPAGPGSRKFKPNLRRPAELN